MSTDRACQSCSTKGVSSYVYGSSVSFAFRGAIAAGVRFAFLIRLRLLTSKKSCGLNTSKTCVCRYSCHISKPNVANCIKFARLCEQCGRYHAACVYVGPVWAIIGSFAPVWSIIGSFFGSLS